ncbi:MAG: DUF4198 domain-containing protein [Pseudomonadota bacterium]
MTSSALAHELWLDPLKYQAKKGEKIVADIVVGQNFVGSRQPYIPDNFVRFDIALGDEMMPVAGRLGDRPAANIDALGDGLNVLIYQTTALDVFYIEWEKFLRFVEHKDFKGAAEQHVERGIPTDERFREVYARFAKSLIAVGDGVGQDRAFGLETEIVALENPYTDNMQDGLDIQVLYKDQPRVDAQVEVFERSPIEGVEVNVFTTRTNDQGIATIDVKSGHTYQLDAVVLREPDAVLFDNAAWETLWANLTLAIPAE